MVTNAMRPTEKKKTTTKRAAKQPAKQPAKRTRAKKTVNQ